MFHTIFTPNYQVAFKIFWEQNHYSKWGKKLFQSGAALTSFYFKMGQALLQSGEETVISK